MKLTNQLQERIDRIRDAVIRDRETAELDTELPTVLLFAIKTTVAHLAIREKRDHDVRPCILPRGKDIVEPSARCRVRRDRERSKWRVLDPGW